MARVDTLNAAKAKAEDAERRAWGPDDGTRTRPTSSKAWETACGDIDAAILAVFKAVDSLRFYQARVAELTSAVELTRRLDLAGRYQYWWRKST